jgi:UDP-N-acetylglucosamine--N-acetylmuramyl-(pentapeptide) pyrophosphoryl-undecaprenol N-acetylglucosamine transferase
MKVLIAAGGTGGHVYPGLAVAERLLAAGHDVVWLGNPDSFEWRAVQPTGIPFCSVRITALRGKGSFALLAAPLRLWRAVRASLRILRHERPQVVLGMGGFVAGPAGLAAWLTRRPLVIHEQNARAGLTNRLLSRLAREVLLGFEAALPGGRVVGNPVRAGIAALPPPEQRFAGRQGPLRLLVIGGSQGARALNEALPGLIASLPPERRPQIRHQGGRSLPRAEAAYAQAGVSADCVAFIDDMAAAYAWADVIICRAGASTVAELAACGLAALLVPFPHAVDDHQTANAEILVRAGAAVCLAENLLTPTAFQRWWQGLDRDRLMAMAQAARSAGRPQATADIVERLEVAGGRA